MTPTSTCNSQVCMLVKVPLQHPVSKSSSEMCFTPSHLLKPRNSKFSAWDLSADSWISLRCILASFYTSPQQLDTQHTFTRKRPVIGFAGRTTSEINVLCTAIYLPWVCVCVSVSSAKPSHCSLPAPRVPSWWRRGCQNCHQTASGKGVSFGEEACFPGSGRQARGSQINLLLLLTNLFLVTVPESRL